MFFALSAFVFFEFKDIQPSKARNFYLTPSMLTASPLFLEMSSAALESEVTILLRPFYCHRLASYINITVLNKSQEKLYKIYGGPYMNRTYDLTLIRRTL